HQLWDPPAPAHHIDGYPPHPLTSPQPAPAHPQGPGTTTKNRPWKTGSPCTRLSTSTQNRPWRWRTTVATATTRSPTRTGLTNRSRARPVNACEASMTDTARELAWAQRAWPPTTPEPLTAIPSGVSITERAPRPHYNANSSPTPPPPRT